MIAALIPIASRIFLEPDNSDGLVVALLVSTNHLLAHTQALPQFRLGDAFGDPEFHDEWREAIDFGKLQVPKLQLIVFVQFLFKLPNHALIASTDRCRPLTGFLFGDFGERPPKSLDLRCGPFSLRVVFNHRCLT